ncbi:LIC_10190 family membrane protein [Leptothermofonsia sp. ETS-13]|uniref:LIC_10190 family membrane protein n=1 Tax=Leptothermofonsia sp. ETS-13 TaxID=3035696 RepID=UPI003BA35C95
MLYFIAAWILLLIGCCVIGTGLLNALRANQLERMGDRFILAVWLGIVVLSVTLLAVSLISPLSPLVGAVTAGLLCTLSLLSPRSRIDLAAFRSALSLQRMAGFGLVAVMIAALTSHQVTWIDTGIYHYGAINWLAKFGTVPGLALLMNNLGFTSSWFALAAPFNPEIFDARVSAVTNSFLIWIAVIQLLISINLSVHNQARLSDWFIIVLAGLLPLSILSSRTLVAIALSPSPDFPVLWLVEVVAWTMIVLSEFNAVPPVVLEDRRQTKRANEWMGGKVSEWITHPSSYPSPSSPHHPITPLLHPLPYPPIHPSIHHSLNDLGAQAIPLILAAGAMTMKPTALPLVLVSGLFFMGGRKRWFRKGLIASAILIVLLSPMLLSGVVKTGCPLYPSSILCLDLPWSQSLETVRSVANSTHQWTSWYGKPPTGTIPWLWSFQRWLRDNYPNQILVALIAIALLATVCHTKSLLTNPNPGQRWLTGLGFTGMTFIMLKAPWIRFCIPYIVLLIGLSAAICFHKWFGSTFPLIHSLQSYDLNRSKSHQVIKWLPVFVGSLIVATCISNAQARIFLPPRMRNAQVEQRQVNDVVYFHTQGDYLCWATQIPCSFQPSKHIQLRDPNRGIAGGFVRKLPGDRPLK